MSQVTIGDISVGNELPLALLGGMNVLESRDIAMQVAEAFALVTSDLGMPYVFKASFDKANRSSISSFRGPGLDEGLKILQEVSTTFSVPVVTDIHEIAHVKPTAEVCEVLQIPAFLARQTDLVCAAAATQAVIHIKKPQFMSPSQIRHLVGKITESGNTKTMICERGSCFGYDNVVVDMLGFRTMKRESNNAPITFDVTHSLQMRGAGDAASGGRRSQVAELGRAGLAVGIAALFLEAHPEPDQAKCDGPSALPLHLLKPFLQQMQKVDDLVKSLPELVIE